MHRIPFVIADIKKRLGLTCRVAITIGEDMMFNVYNIDNMLKPEIIYDKDKKTGEPKPLINIAIEPLFKQTQYVNLVLEKLKANEVEIENFKKSYSEEVGNELAELEKIKRTKEQDVKYHELKIRELEYNNYLKGLEGFNDVYRDTCLFEMEQNDITLSYMIENYSEEIKKAEKYLKLLPENLENYERRTALKKLINTGNPKSKEYIDSPIKKINDYEKINIYRQLVTQNQMIRNFLGDKIKD